MTGTTDGLHGSISLASLQNVLVGSYGTGDAPILNFTGGTRPSQYAPFFHLDGSSKNITVRDLHFTSDAIPTAGELEAPQVIDLTGSNVAVADCTWGNINGILSTTSMSGILFQGNTAGGGTGDVANRLSGYMIDVQSAKYIVAQGNTDGGSKYESDMRFHPSSDPSNPTEYVLVYGNTLRYQHDQVGSKKSALRLENDRFGYAEYNLLEGPSNWLGPLNNSGDTGTSTDLVYDSNVVYGFENSDGTLDSHYEPGYLKLEPGLSHSVIRNNIFWGSSGITVADSNDPATRVVSDLWIVNNTRSESSEDRFAEFGLRSGLRFPAQSRGRAAPTSM